MKKHILIILGGIALLVAACGKSDIPVYRLEDSAVCFPQITNNFSLRGMTEPERRLTIPVTLIGPAADYDRPLNCQVEEVSATQGADFTLESAEVAAGALSGSIVLNVKKLTADTPSRSIRITLLPNEHFREGYPAYLKADITWSESYERPQEHVWRYWHLYLSKSYSRNWHQFLVEVYGDEIERYTAGRPFAEQEGLTYKITTWWMAANHELLDIVRKHDLENPGHPYRHSEDYESYTSYLLPVGKGVGLAEGQTPPTFLETINAL